MQATYSNPKPSHMNCRKNGSVRELRWAFWSAPPLNYSDKLSLHLWRQVFLYGLMSCCGWIVSSFTLSLLSWLKLTLLYCFPGPNCIVEHEGQDLLLSYRPSGTVNYWQVAQEWSSQGIQQRMTPCVWLPFPLTTRLWPYNALSPKNELIVIYHSVFGDVTVQTWNKTGDDSDIFSCFCVKRRVFPENPRDLWSFQGGGPRTCNCVQRKGKQIRNTNCQTPLKCI